MDVQKTGRLDLEQYAKCILLIRECQEGLTSKISMSIASPAPPMALTRRDSQISTNSVCLITLSANLVEYILFVFRAQESVL